VKRLRIRYRVDGALNDVPVPDHIHKLDASVVARLKIMAHLDVAERRLPQDGRINLSYEGRSIDARVASIPSIALSNGVILATGPTGSGKSTSLYCFLDRLNVPETRTVTIEDPVENKLPGIVQIAVKADVGLTFAKGLRSILRADPNIVMVGEIRDTETAEIAIRASLTGHLVMSTLHTNSAIGAVSRLIDMGVEPFLVAASVKGLLAQRLVRKLCPYCRVESVPWSREKRSLYNIADDVDLTTYEASKYGCPECRNTGYKGRLAIYELCLVTERIQAAITDGLSEQEILEIAVSDCL